MRRFGLDEVVKLASNEFPQPPLAEHDARAPSQVVVGAGSCELLMLLGDVLLEQGDEVVFADPSFVVYNDICRLHEARAVAVPLVDFRHDLEAMVAAVTPRTKMVVVCNPNNPTGTYVPAADITRLVEAVPEDVLVMSAAG